MDLNVTIIFFILFWATIIFTHYLLESCWVHPYINLAKLIGLKVKPFYLGVYWTRFNHGLTRFVVNYDKLIKRWMHLGVFASLFMTPISICILIQTIVNLISVEKDHSSDFGSLEPFLPGVNLPLSEILYYVIALALSSVFHEFGHFIAAIREKIRVNGVGLSLFAFLPIAYVDISEDQLNKLSVGSKLRIFCAGVWHNLILGLLAASLLLLNPYLLRPLYNTGEGAVLAHSQKIWEASSGIQPGDVLTSINRNCHLTSKEDWKDCFVDLMSHYDSGYCISNKFIDRESIKPKGIKCCDEEMAQHLCFVDLSNNEKMCLPARPLLERFKAYCNETSINCSGDYSCVRPNPETDGFRLIEIRRKDKPSFLFWGHPYEIYSTLTLVNYNPKFTWLPVLWIHRWETLLRYVSSFSLALALLNSIPCYIMDGKYIAKSSLDLLFGKILSKSTMNFVQLSLSFFGTILVLSCVLLGFYSIILRNKIIFV